MIKRHLKFKRRQQASIEFIYYSTLRDYKLHDNMSNTIVKLKNVLRLYMSVVSHNEFQGEFNHTNPSKENIPHDFFHDI